MLRSLACGLLIAALSQRPVAALTAESDLDALAKGRDELVVSMALTQPEHGDAVVSLAELRASETTPKPARRLYEKALESERKGDQERAMQQVTAAIEIAPGFFQAHAALAAGYLKSGEIEEAERQVEIALNLNPDYLPAREIGGLVLFFRGKFREASNALGELVKKAPCRKSIHYFLGRALFKLGDHEGAERELETARTLQREPPRSVPDPLKSWGGSTLPMRKFP